MSDLKENLSLVLHPSGELKLEKRMVPQPTDEEVLIAIEWTGICGSDIHVWSRGEIAKMKNTHPTVLGHESSGTIVAVGKKVENFKIGDRVAIETSGPCLKCRLCLEGNYHLCPTLIRLGLCPYDGAFARYLAHSAQFCFKLPDKLSLEEGAMIEPLSVAVHACRRGKVTAGDHVLICGAGPIGLLTMLTARAMGATKICVTDVKPDRLDLAKKLGADLILVVDADSDICAQKVIGFMGTAPDVSFDCCGLEASLSVVLKATKPRGSVVVVGIGPSDPRLPLSEAMLKEVEILGVNRYPNCYPRAIELVESGLVDVNSLITHRFPLEDAVEAFNFVRKGVSGTVKTLIRCKTE